jgi:hypothetical protein
MPSKNNEYAYEASTIDSKTVTTASSTVLAANAQRRSAVLVNTGAGDIYLAIGRTAEAGKGICLKAGGSAYELHALNLTHAAITAVTASGTSTLSIHEGI